MQGFIVSGVGIKTVVIAGGAILVCIILLTVVTIVVLCVGMRHLRARVNDLRKATVHCSMCLSNGSLLITFS